MKRSGSADLPLRSGRIPPWLYGRMKQLTLPMVEAILMNGGKDDFLRRLSDPFWFQSFGAVIGMDWNSSGVTTIVMSALKESLNPHSKELGIYICGGKGKSSTKTPSELIRVGDKTGLNGAELARASRLSAKVDNTALQDGFQIYAHNFIVTDSGKWAVVQQGMHPENSMARRYHWHSENMDSFVEEPHTAICGINQGEILNLVDIKAKPTQKAIVEITSQNPDEVLRDLPKLIVPHYKDVRTEDVDLKRLGSVLWLAQETEIENFEELLLLKGLGPRTLQSLTLVSEVMFGTSSRFEDPARYSFAHGSKGGIPIPVPTKIYDEVIVSLKDALDKAKIGRSDKIKAIGKLSEMSRKAEENFEPNEDLEAVIKNEKRNAYKYGGRTIQGFSRPPETQLRLFDEADPSQES